MSKKQKTIQKEVSLTGVGLHTGNNVKMTFKPAPENHGFAFKRVDLEGCPTIEARAEFVVNTQRGTNLEKNGVLIQTSEHVLAAAVGLDIDNLIIEINASEPPIMDGSSKFFVKALEKAGITISKKIGRQVFHDINGPYVVDRLELILLALSPMRQLCIPFTENYKD